MSSARSPIALLTIALLIASCAPMAPRDMTPLTEIRSPLLADAEAALALGDTSSALTLLRMAAAEVAEPGATGLRLEAAALALEQGDTTPARALLGSRHAEATPANAAIASLLRTRLAADLPASTIIERLRGLPAPLSPRLEALRLRTLARAEAAEGNINAALDHWLAVGELAVSGPQRYASQARLWSMLMAAPLPTLREALAGVGDNAARAWLQLAIGVRNRALDPAQTRQFVRDWRQRHTAIDPGEAFVERLRAVQRADLAPPATVAVLLPLSGELAGAGEAIHRGLLAGHYADGSGPDRPRLLFYDVGADSDVSAANARVIEAYNEAVSAGAGLVIGPLRKAAVRALLASDDLPVPVLALNRVAAPAASDSVRQFGLAPEDDARAVAALAAALDHERLLILARGDDWGGRVGRAFADAFETAGGRILAQRRYPPGEQDLRGPIRDLFELDLSEQRRQRLASITGEDFGFEPRRRQDADGVFIAAFGEDARLVTPQIRFHRGIDLPVFAVSESYPQNPTAAANEDLDGVMLTRMPWLLADTAQPVAAGARRQLDAADPDAAPRQLVALGVDSYRLLSRLDALERSPEQHLPGATGRLHLDTEGRIRRQLIPARISARGLERLRRAPRTDTPLPAYLP